ncbi:hypothetical protein CHUAL_008275 [Chamberlinius hualienensis]
MGQPIEEYDSNPYSHASYVSKLLFWWLFPLLKKGFRNEISPQDFHPPTKSDRAKGVHEKCRKAWTNELSKAGDKRSPSLFKALWTVAKKRYLVCSMLYFTKFYLLGLVSSLLMGLLVRKLESLEGDEWPAFTIYGYATIVTATFGLGAFIIHQAGFVIERQGMRLRTGCCSLIFRKALRLSRALMADASAGKFFNIVSGDVSRFDQLTVFQFSVWIDPISIVLVLGILYPLFGVAVLPGIGSICLIAIMQVIQGKVFKKLRFRKSMATDERLKITNGLLSDIKVVKMYSWETPFIKLINKIRKEELKVIAMSLAVRTLNMVVYVTGAKFPLFLSVLTVVLLGDTVTTEMLFVSYAMYGILKMNAMYVFPNGVQRVAESLVSMKRLQAIMLLEEKSDDKRIQLLQNIDADKISIMVNGLTAGWKKESVGFHITGLNLSLASSSLCFVTGPVGSGKSSLLMALMGENVIKSGQVTIKGKLAYVSQESWLFPATIKNNILFSLPYDEQRYQQVLEACALTDDIRGFPEGDQSLVGDRGVTLSGGQKARIHLARAVYHNADVYLMDDCLSAVDARVGNHLFRNCVNGMLGNRLKILVTHQLHYMTPESYVVVLKDGNVLKQGVYSELCQAEKKDSDKKVDILSQTTFCLDAMDLENLHAPEKPEADEKKSKQDYEEISSKTASLAAYLMYFKSAHNWFSLTLFILVNVSFQVIECLFEIWLAVWMNAQTQAEDEFRMHNETHFYYNSSNFNIYLGDHDVTTPWDAFKVFTWATIAIVVMSLIRTTMFFSFCFKASCVLHSRLLTAVLKSRMNFFTVNPVGRIMNRFSKDMDAIDDILPNALYDEIVEFTSTIGVICVIIYIDPWLSIPSAALIAVIGIFGVTFIRSSAIIKRCEALKRSPIFVLMSNSIQGQVTIRAHKAEANLSEQFDQFQDDHSAAWFLFLSLTRWFSTWIETAFFFYIGIAIFRTVGSKGDFTGSDIGLIITLISRIPACTQWAIRQGAEAETQMTSVERVQEYSELPSEDGYDRELPLSLPTNWPSQGSITFNNVSLSYSSSAPPVLKHLSFSIKAGEKIGIVGRTGAGKSSIITALFRLSDIEGDITIDGVSTSSVSLSALRRGFSIIPQDPVLFVGTIRYNLDPFEEQNDEALWNALDEVRMRESVMNLDKGLDSMVAEGGSNISVGQRQLLCLARAILRNSRIILLDEATSNIDKKSDEIVQTVLRKRFHDCTILIIAHRLDTIIDVDRVMVLHEGRLLEFDEPFHLLQNEESSFSKLVSQTGKIATARLMNLAQVHHLYVRGLSVPNQQTPTDIIIPDIKIENKSF